MARSKNKRKNGKVKSGKFTSKNNCNSFRVNCMTGQVSRQEGNPFISDAQANKIKNHLQSSLQNVRLRASSHLNLSQEEGKDIARNIYHSKLLKEGEMPEGSAMYAAPKKLGEAYWNIGMFGSVWCDLEIFNGRKFRIAFTSDGFFTVEGEL